jgi:hypothetical protein
MNATQKDAGENADPHNTSLEANNSDISDQAKYFETNDVVNIGERGGTSVPIDVAEAEYESVEKNCPVCTYLNPITAAICSCCYSNMD